MEKTSSDMEVTVGGKYNYDKKLMQRIEKLADKRPFREIMQVFPAYTKRINLTRFLAYYELFRMIKNKPGWIVECGIYRGFSLFALGKFMEIFCMGDKTRKIIGFDNFSGFTELSPQDGHENKECTKIVGGGNPGDFRDDFMELLDICNKDAFAPWVERIIVVEGNIEKTIPEYVEKNSGLRISLLHLDIDLYKPTNIALKHFYPRVVAGGLVVLDEYAHIDWGGESKAFEDYFENTGQKIPELKTFSWVGNPTTYFIKE